MKPASEKSLNRRTRKQLLLAAARLLKHGRTPTIEDVAQEAMVSRATVYRYFSTIDDLLVEAPLDESVPDSASLFSKDSTLNIEERVNFAEAVMHEAVYRNEAQLRLMLAKNLQRPKQADNSQQAPVVRQSRRLDYIDAALSPMRHQFTPSEYERLRAALAIIFGTESMIVLRDVMPVNERKARDIKSWAVCALVRAAIKDAKRSSASGKQSVRKRH